MQLAKDLIPNSTPGWVISEYSSNSVHADGKGDDMMLVKLEAWVKGGSSAAPHLQLLCFLLQSSLAAQRQLLEDACLAARYVLSAG